jgi:hypothetical protein
MLGLILKQMTLPSLKFFRSSPSSEASPTLKAALRGNVQWERTVFKAPPLRVQTPSLNTKDFSEVFGGELASR